jgi:hypothetical protein
LILFLLSFSACTLEQRLARDFVKYTDPGDFYILKPSYLIKYNLKEYDLEGMDSLDEVVRDSILLENSLFLKAITDSLLIEQMLEGLGNSLQSYGASVLPEHAVDSLMANGGNTYILNLAQFTLEEYTHPYRIEEPYYDELIVVDGIDVNALNFNLWLELGMLNSEEGNKVLFTSDYLFDQVNGTIKQNLITGEMRFDYVIDTINVQQVYKSAYQFGQKAGSKLYDYLMNEYINLNLPETYPYKGIYFHYDPRRRLIYEVDESEMLIRVQPE